MSCSSSSLVVGYVERKDLVRYIRTSQHTSMHFTRPYCVSIIRSNSCCPRELLPFDLVLGRSIPKFFADRLLLHFHSPIPWDHPNLASGKRRPKRLDLGETPPRSPFRRLASPEIPLDPLTTKTLLALLVTMMLNRCPLYPGRSTLLGNTTH